MTETKTKIQLKPEETFRRGAVAASVWKRQAPSGFEYYDFSLSRAWKAKSSGRDGYSLNFFGHNCEQLSIVIKEATDWITAKQSSLPASNMAGENGNNASDEL